MEQVKICTVCGKNIGKHSCTQCGALVCDYCYSKQRALCANCIAGNR